MEGWRSIRSSLEANRIHDHSVEHFLSMLALLVELWSAQRLLYRQPVLLLFPLALLLWALRWLGAPLVLRLSALELDSLLEDTRYSLDYRTSMHYRSSKVLQDKIYQTLAVRYNWPDIANIPDSRSDSGIDKIVVRDSQRLY